MSGKKGRSGRKPLSAEAHVLRGTFRKDRHGPPPVTGANALKADVVEPIPAGLVKELGAAGVAFVRETWAAFTGWTPPKALLLRKAGELVDAEAALVGGVSGEDVRRWLAVHRALLATLRDLGLEE